MNPVLAELLRTGQVTRGDGTTVTLNSQTTTDKCEALQRLGPRPEA